MDVLAQFLNALLIFIVFAILMLSAAFYSGGRRRRREYYSERDLSTGTAADSPSDRG